MASPLNHMAFLLLSLSWPISLLSSPYPDQLKLLARNQGHQSNDLLPFQRPEHQLVVLPASLLSFWLFLYSVHPPLNSFQLLRPHSLSPVFLHSHCHLYPLPSLPPLPPHPSLTNQKRFLDLAL